MTVVDANVVADAIRATGGPADQALTQAVPPLAVPELLDLEVTSAYRKLVAAGMLTPAEGRRITRPTPCPAHRPPPPRSPVAQDLGVAVDHVRVRRGLRGSGRATWCNPAHARCDVHDRAGAEMPCSACCRLTLPSRQGGPVPSQSFSFRLADRLGFEPKIALQLYSISNAAPSTGLGHLSVE
jgi:hypothetical protein